MRRSGGWLSIGSFKAMIKTVEAQGLISVRQSAEHGSSSSLFLAEAYR